jgi:hypothetical protein
LRPASDDRGIYLYPPNQRAPRKHAWKFGRHAWRGTRAKSI